MKDLPGRCQPTPAGYEIWSAYQSWPNRRCPSESTQDWQRINPLRPTSSRAFWKVWLGGSGWCLQVRPIHLLQLEWVCHANGQLPSERLSRRRRGGTLVWSQLLLTCYLPDFAWTTTQTPKQGGVDDIAPVLTPSLLSGLVGNIRGLERPEVPTQPIPFEAGVGMAAHEWIPPKTEAPGPSHKVGVIPLTPVSQGEVSKHEPSDKGTSQHNSPCSRLIRRK